MKEIKDLHKNIMDNYGSKLKTKLYKDKNFDSRGTNYSDFVKLKYESINKGHIKDKYTINGWYILWYLMANAQQSKFIQTNIYLITSMTKLKKEYIKEALFQLDKEKVIYIECLTSTGKEKSRDTIGFGDMLTITIIYNEKDYADNNGYRAIPVDYVKNILPTISPKEWAILTILITKYSFFIPLEPKMNDYGQVYYTHQLTHYAFPTYKQMSDFIGISESSIKTYVDKLEKSKYKPIERLNDAKGNRYKDGRNSRENYLYSIPLLERVEYNYYHIYIHNKNNAKKFDKLIDTNKQYELRNHDYIVSKFPVLKQYEKAIKENDVDWYNTYEQMILAKEI